MSEEMAKGTESHRSENLYLAAYCLVQGARLEQITLTRGNGRSTAVFALTGEGVDRFADEYYAGTAVVNLARYREKLERLKDELFAALKQNKTETETETERRTHDAHRQGRARGAQARR